jgi:hypothetical protein
MGRPPLWWRSLRSRPIIDGLLFLLSTAAVPTSAQHPQRADPSRNAAASSDGVIHLAFKHVIAFSGDFQGAADADPRAIETFDQALAGSDRPYVIASGTLGLAPGRVATEREGQALEPAAPPMGSGLNARLANAQLTLSFG